MPLVQDQLLNLLSSSPAPYQGWNLPLHKLSLFCNDCPIRTCVYKQHMSTMNGWCFRPRFCTVKAILGRRQHGWRVHVNNKPLLWHTTATQFQRMINLSSRWLTTTGFSSCSINTCPELLLLRLAHTHPNTHTHARTRTHKFFWVFIILAPARAIDRSHPLLILLHFL